MAGMQPIPTGPRVMHSEYTTHNSWCLRSVLRADLVLHSRTGDCMVRDSQYDPRGCGED